MTILTKYGVNFKKNEGFITFENSDYVKLLKRLISNVDGWREELNTLYINSVEVIEIVENFLGIRFVGFQK